MDDEIIRERLTEETDKAMAAKLERYGAATMRAVEKQVLLQTIDRNWREHLVTLDHLRSVVGFRGYAQRDPLNEYKSEAFQLFEALLNKLRSEVTRLLAHVQVMTQEEQQAMIADLQARSEAARAAARPQPAEPAPAAQPARVPAMAAAGPDAESSAAVRSRRRPLGAVGPQRSLPLRIGQEIQALPRPALTQAACRQPFVRNSVFVQYHGLDEYSR